MSDSDNPQSPYSPNDPRNPRNPTDQKNPNDPLDPKNPKSPFGPGGPADPQGRQNVPSSPAPQIPIEYGRDGKGQNPNLGLQQPPLSTLKPSPNHNKSLQAVDIKALIQNQGKVTFQGRDLILIEPSATDPRFQEMINEPTLSVTALGDPSKNGDCEYELKSSGRILKIKVNSKDKREVS
ncbi:MAG: hypothetical protein H0X26_03315 [Alphaproteobacteria bacterium]|nr:hypothetical protein [Alphaproteobacteria bacterium]